MASLELLETFADGIDVLLDPWASGWDLWVAGWLGFEPLGSKMLMILDNLPMRRFFFEKFSSNFGGSVRGVHWMARWLLLDPGGSDPPRRGHQCRTQGCPSPWS